MPVLLLRDARPTGWVSCFSICASTMPKEQNRAAKGSILKEDEILCQSGFIIYLWFKYRKHFPSWYRSYWLLNQNDKKWFKILFLFGDKSAFKSSYTFFARILSIFITQHSLFLGKFLSILDVIGCTFAGQDNLIAIENNQNFKSILWYWHLSHTYYFHKSKINRPYSKLICWMFHLTDCIL